MPTPHRAHRPLEVPLHLRQFHARNRAQAPAAALVEVVGSAEITRIVVGEPLVQAGRAASGDRGDESFEELNVVDDTRSHTEVSVLGTHGLNVEAVGQAGDDYFVQWRSASRRSLR